VRELGARGAPMKYPGLHDEMRSVLRARQSDNCGGWRGVSMVTASAAWPRTPCAATGEPLSVPAVAGPHGSLSPTAPAVRMVRPRVPAPAPRRAPPHAARCTSRSDPSV